MSFAYGKNRRKLADLGLIGPSLPSDENLASPRGFEPLAGGQQKAFV